MKKLNVISLILAGLITLTVFAGCGNNTDNPDTTDTGTDTTVDTSADDTTGEDTTSDYVPEENPYTRPEETYEGVQGIALRTTVVPDANVFDGTQVTDVIIPASMADQAVNITGENEVNVWLTFDVVKADEAELAAVDAAIAAAGIFGIELNFCTAEHEMGGEYNNLAILNEFLIKVREKINAKDTLKLAVLVPSDINACYNHGVDIGEWVSKKYVDVVAPYSGSDFNNTDIPVRLWTSLTDPYGVMLMPVISQTLKHTEKAEGYPQTPETLAGDAANYISQGADKISVGDWAFAESLKVIGSYETVMTIDRMHVLTYNNYTPEWANNTAYLPKVFSASGWTTLRVPMGNIPEGAKVTLLVEVNLVPSGTPEVYVNSQLCTYIGIDESNEKVLCYELPDVTRGDGYVVAEFKGASGAGNTQIEHFAVKVDVQ